jgi:hypothetical protein
MPTVVFLVLVIAVSATVGVASTVVTSTHGRGNGSSVILPAGTSFNVISSADCLASHYSLNFSVEYRSEFAGGFSAEAPGVTGYVATAQQASFVSQGHPASWVYSTGLARASHFAVALSPGSYVVWIEGADQNCGSSIVTPLEMMTRVNITEDFKLISQPSVGLAIQLALNSSRIASGATIGVNVSDYNQSPTELNMSKNTGWALNGLSTGGCPSLYFPFGISVFKGWYTGANASQATPLRVFSVVACPMIVRYITGYLFKPMSDSAIVLPGAEEVPMATEISLSGTYGDSENTLNQGTPFPPGTYTVAAGDEWGNLVFAHFVVAPQSSGVAKYVYPSSDLSASISAGLARPSSFRSVPTPVQRDMTGTSARAPASSTSTTRSCRPAH